MLQLRRFPFRLISCTVLVIASMVAVLPLPAHAADKGENPGYDTGTEAELVTAPVEIDGRVMFRVRGATSYPAEQRAATIGDRIEKAAADASLRVDELHAVDSGNFTTIMARDLPIMVVSEADARLEQMGRNDLARIHMLRIRKAIDEYRALRTRDILLRRCLNAAVATIIFIPGVILLIRLGRRLDRLMMDKVRNRIQSVGIKSFEILRAEHIWTVLHGLYHVARVTVVLLLFLVYLNFSLAQFPWTRGYAYHFLDLILSPLHTVGKGVVAVIPDLFVLLVLFFLFRFILRLLHLFFHAVDRKTMSMPGFDPEWALPTYKIIRFAVIAFGVVMAYPYIPGSGSGAFKGVSIFVGVLFSLSSSSAISNIIAGYMLIYRRAFKVGDRVRIGDVTGDVTQTRVQVTHLMSVKNEEIIIPNSQILNGNVINYSSKAQTLGLILHTSVGIGYETPWRQVEAMLLMAAERTPGLLKEPRPFVLQKSLGDFAINYEINVYCDMPHEMIHLYTLLHRNILDVFNEYGVQIMTPAYRGDTAEPKVVPREQWYAKPATPESEVG